MRIEIHLTSQLLSKKKKISYVHENIAIYLTVNKIKINHAYKRLISNKTARVIQNTAHSQHGGLTSK